MTFTPSHGRAALCSEAAPALSPGNRKGKVDEGLGSTKTTFLVLWRGEECDCFASAPLKIYSASTVADLVAGLVLSLEAAGPPYLVPLGSVCVLVQSQAEPKRPSALTHQTTNTVDKLLASVTHLPVLG